MLSHFFSVLKIDGFLNTRSKLLNFLSDLCLKQNAAPPPKSRANSTDTLSKTDSSDDDVNVCDQPSKLLPLQRLASLEPQEVIGAGGFGKILLCKNSCDSTVYAMKMIDLKSMTRKKQIQRIIVEHRVLKNSTHPFIVKMHGAFRLHDMLCMILEYCPGGDLYHQITKQRSFSTRKAVRYIAEIILAIESLHSRGIIYRDLKPENLMLGFDGHIRLVDFGLAKDGLRLPKKQRNSSFCGSVDYLSPEVIEHKEQSFAVDWWGVGCVFYEMLTGLPPFSLKLSQNHDGMMPLELEDNTHAAAVSTSTFKRILTGIVYYPSNMNNSARNLISGLLERNPDMRLGCGPSGTAEIKEHPLFAEYGIDFGSIIDTVGYTSREFNNQYSRCNAHEGRCVQEFTPAEQRENAAALKFAKFYLPWQRHQVERKFQESKSESIANTTSFNIFGASSDHWEDWLKATCRKRCGRTDMKTINALKRAFPSIADLTATH